MKKVKFSRVFAVLLALVITVSAFPMTALPASAATTSNGLVYEIADGEVTITDYTGSATEFEIPSAIEGYPVTEISNDAFRACTTFTSVTVPDSVTTIGRCAFYGCTSLASIILPETLMTIGDSAFEKTAYYKSSKNWVDNVLYIGCYLIEAKSEISGSYVIKDGTKSIANQAFFNCDSITSVAIPEGLISLCDSAFYGCDNLASISLPNGITSIGARSFQACISLTNVVIPGGVIGIGDYAFSYCRNLTSITFPKGLASIGDNAFYECTSLATVYYGGSEETMGDISIGSNNSCLINAEIVYAYVTGDLNGDDAVNSMDVNLMKRVLAGVLTLTDEQMTVGDLDGNGQINSFDSNDLSKIIAGSN